MRVLGIDPDLHRCGIAVVEKESSSAPLKVLDFITANVSKQYLESIATLHMIGQLSLLIPQMVQKYKPFCVISEGQKYYLKGVPRRGVPSDLINLAIISGAGLGISVSNGIRYIELPAPSEWKGSVRKDIFHQRIVRKLEGWEARFANRRNSKTPIIEVIKCPLENRFIEASVSIANWSHILDAIGIAIWGCSKYFDTWRASGGTAYATDLKSVEDNPLVGSIPT